MSLLSSDNRSSASFSTSVGGVAVRKSYCATSCSAWIAFNSCRNPARNRAASASFAAAFAVRSAAITQFSSSAERYGWKIGDRIPLTSPIWQPKEPWQFNLVGIYDGEPSVDKTQFFFRYDYFDENRAQAQGTVGWYIVKISDPARAVEMSRTFDEMFANSGAETKTTTEKGFVESFAKQIGDIGSITVAIASTVLFMFGLVAASTMVQSVRERTSELAVLKTVGFTDTESWYWSLWNLCSSLCWEEAWGSPRPGRLSNAVILLAAFYPFSFCLLPISPSVSRSWC